ncbi:hypothetical protein GCM10010954_28220 [Halobacillus andaensis]|uniref:Lipoprotein n=1 Tax=Halobacillus andaensis TaxID=1176239 RepID=A0A917EZ50_HALAA|nr:hypothetical protein [Halobacillus andaensis]MBP2006453.1 hypothetical protein [Halobacillus andaensis]GGF27493.1 hypothetical protein GCM10010954_28220 [Halobacillus andaensis]
MRISNSSLITKKGGKSSFIKLAGVLLLSLVVIAGCGGDDSETQGAENSEEKQEEPQNPVDESKVETSEQYLQYFYKEDGEEAADAEEKESFIEEHVHEDMKDFMSFLMLAGDEESDQVKSMEAAQQVSIEEEGETMEVVQVKVTNTEDEKQNVYVLYVEDKIMMFPLNAEEIRKYDSSEDTEEEQLFNEEDMEEMKDLIDQIESEFEFE